MAEKRRLETVGTVSYSKIPRLEAEPGQLLAADLCKPGLLSDYASENYYGYKGSYFTYPLHYQEGPKTLTHWPPAEAYPHYTGSGASQHRQMEKELCTLYRQEVESFRAQGQNHGHGKGGEGLARDALSAQERWASYMGYPSYVPQGWIHSYMAPQSPQMPTGCPTLAVPKPIYRHPIYSVESSYSLQSSLDLGVLPENTRKLPHGTEWALPPLVPLSCMENSSYGATEAKKAAAAETNFPQLPPGPKDAATSPAGFLPYRKSFEKCQGAQSVSFLEGSYRSTYSSQKTISKAHGGSLSKHAWSKLPPPTSPQVHPPPLVYQDRSSACYPLTSQEQMLLYHQSYPQAEKRNSLLALLTSKSFGSPGSKEPPYPPGSYFPPTSRSYHPGYQESYPYKPVGPPPMTPPGPQSAQEQQSQQGSAATVDVPQNALMATSAQPEKTSCSGPWPPRDWGKDRRNLEQPNESFPSQQPAPQSGAFQTFHLLDRSPDFDGIAQTQEASCGQGLCPSEGAKAREKEPPHMPKWSSMTSDAKEINFANCKTESEACIIIPDGLVTPHDGCCKAEEQVPDVPEDSSPPLQNGPHLPEGKVKDTTTRPEMPLPPSSPPMPVINNVFSLAPYKDYLDGTSNSVEIPLSNTGQSEKISCKNTRKSGAPSAQPDCLGPSEVPQEKDVACKAAAEVNEREQNNNCTGSRKESGEFSGNRGSFRVTLLSPNGSASSQPGSKNCANGQAGEKEREGGALDLSCKMESLVDTPILQGGSSESNGVEVRERPPNGHKVLPETNRQASELPMQNGSERKCNFQSSAAFLFKKFKIRKSETAEAGSAVQQASSLSSSPNPPIAALSSDFSAQQCSEQVATRKNNSTLPQSPCQETTQQNSPTDRQSPGQGAPPQNSSLVQQKPHQDTTQQTGQRSGHQAVIWPKMQILQLRCFNVKLPDTSKALLPSSPAGSPPVRKANSLHPANDEFPGHEQSSPGQYFTDLHTSVCTIISCSVSASSSEQLKEWLEKAESDRALKAEAASLAKQKNDVKASNVPKPPKSKQVWLTFKDMVALFRKLLSQLETFLLTQKCPFPHVVRAGTIFIPIHVVKEKLFPNLPGTSVDHVLQDHKVELRPTTLSEERLLRDLELKSCTSRMLKLLALKQLPDIYPDLLTLHWHNCIKQQLGPSSQSDLNPSK